MEGRGGGAEGRRGGGAEGHRGGGVERRGGGVGGGVEGRRVGARGVEGERWRRGAGQIRKHADLNWSLILPPLP